MGKKCSQGDLGFDPSEGCAVADVDAAAESEVLVVPAGGVEPVGVAEPLRIVDVGEGRAVQQIRHLRHDQGLSSGASRCCPGKYPGAVKTCRSLATSNTRLQMTQRRPCSTAASRSRTTPNEGAIATWASVIPWISVASAGIGSPGLMSVSIRTSPAAVMTPRSTMRASSCRPVVSVSKMTVSGSARTSRAHSSSASTSRRRISMARSSASRRSRSRSARSRSSRSAQGGHQRGPHPSRRPEACS